MRFAYSYFKAVETEAWVDNFSIPLELNNNRNVSFTGRHEALEYIQSLRYEIKSKRKAATPLVIYGTGGVGKTQLVQEYAYAHADDFSSIIWVDAQSLYTAQNSFLRFLQKLIHLHARRSAVSPPPYTKIARHLRIADLVDGTGTIVFNETVVDRVVSAVREWLNRSGNTDWLLVFDNVDDLETFRVSDFFPNSLSGYVILTSRRPECSRLGEGWELHTMEEQESITLLSQSYARDIRKVDDGMYCSNVAIYRHRDGQALLTDGIDYDEAGRIVEKLGYLPLAIDQAGAYLRTLSKPLHAFLPLFHANFKTALNKKPPSSVWQYGERTVVTTWEISFEAVEKKDPKAAKLLLLCSFLFNKDINTEFLFHGLPNVFNAGESTSADFITS